MKISLNDKLKALSSEKYEEMVLGECYQAIREWIKLRVSLVTVFGAATTSVTTIAIQNSKPFLLCIAAGLLLTFVVADLLLRMYVSSYLYISWKIERKYQDAVFGISHASILWHGHGDKIASNFEKLSLSKEGLKKASFKTFAFPLGYASRTIYVVVLVTAFALLLTSYFSTGKNLEGLQPGRVWPARAAAASRTSRPFVRRGG